jgi:hypothetical protein
MRLTFPYYKSLFLMALIVAGCNSAIPPQETDISTEVSLTATEMPFASSVPVIGPVEKCIPISSKTSSVDAFSGHLVVSYQDVNRFNYFKILDGNSEISLTEPGKPGGFYAAVSPDHHWLAYEQWMSEDFVQHWLIVTALNTNEKIEIPWKDNWNNVAYWVDSKHILIRSEAGFFILDPFDKTQEETSMEFDNLYHFEKHWEGYLNVSIMPETSRLIYPTNEEGLNLITFPDKKIIASVPYAHIGTTPKWSPNGRHFVFLAPNSFDPDLDGVALIVGTPEGEFEQFLLPMNTYDLYNFSWSPDGRYIAFWRNYSKQEAHLNIFDLAHRQLVDTCIKSQINWFFSSKENTPVWSPDGNKLAFIVGGEDSPDDIELVVLDLRESIGVKIKESYRPIGWLSREE